MSNELAQVANELAQVAAAAIRRYSEIMTGTTENVDMVAFAQAVDDVTLKTYIVEQTEQFRVRAHSEDQALGVVTDSEGRDEQIEWLACTNRQVVG